LIHGHFIDHAMNQARSMPDWLDKNVTTLPKLLHDAGYATALFGKWHLGHETGAPPPSEYGFDVSKTVNSNGPQLCEDPKDPYFRAKSSAMIVDETIAFIKANKDRPFYANVWTLLPHAPLKPTPEQLKVYESLAPKAHDPAFGPWMQKYLAAAKDLKSQMQVYCASLTDLDTQLGRLFAALDEMKLADNTLIFFSSDNGAEDYRLRAAANAGVGNTGPLRARKRSLYEGGIRTFGLLRWPRHVAANRVDETSVTGGVDFLPTICKLTHVVVPASVRPDGEDVSDIWLGHPRERTKPLFWEWLFHVQGDDYTPPMLAIRDGDWKLFVEHDGSHAQLFDIPKDISEEHDVAARHPDVVKLLSAKVLAWQKSLPPSRARDEATATGKAVDMPRTSAIAPRLPAAMRISSRPAQYAPSRHHG
jgi:N-acetylgalactosamine-6-sulfatase